MQDKLEVRFWGVRGSIPSPGQDTVVVGGNTSCVEVKGGGSRVILDAGSGLRDLGDALVAQGEHGHVQLLLSHVHWDHVMGLPFFNPIYMPGTTLEIAAGPSGQPLREVLRRQMSAPMFPVDFDRLPSMVRCREIAHGGHLELGSITAEACLLHHPDPVYAYRLSFGGRSVVYATDHEHGKADVDARLVTLARGADVLIYDAQYTPEEYDGAVGPSRKGWGHSTFEAGARIAAAARVKTLVLFHHDPRRTDEGVKEIVRRARELFPSTVAAREGLSLSLEAYGALPARYVEEAVPASSP